MEVIPKSSLWVHDHEQVFSLYLILVVGLTCFCHVSMIRKHICGMTEFSYEDTTHMVVLIAIPCVGHDDLT